MNMYRVCLIVLLPSNTKSTDLANIIIFARCGSSHRGRPQKEIERFEIGSFRRCARSNRKEAYCQAIKLPPYGDTIIDVIGERTEVATGINGQFSYIIT